MSTYLSQEVTAGLRAAQKKSLLKSSRLRVHANGDIIKILRYWDNGFAVDRETAPRLRGLVDLFDGGKHLYQCLIVASSNDADEMIYEFKRSTMADDKVPLDFVRDPDAPIALLESK